jgi:hypothetical protein
LEKFGSINWAASLRRETVGTEKAVDEMNGNLVQLGEDLRLYLLRVQVSLNNINGLFAGGAAPSEAELARRLNELQEATKEASYRTTKLREALQDGLEQEATVAPETIAGWIGRRQTAHLHARADLIEQLAATAAELAMLAALEAERITMTAILARQEAVAVQRDGR